MEIEMNTQEHTEEESREERPSDAAPEIQPEIKEIKEKKKKERSLTKNDKKLLALVTVIILGICVMRYVVGDKHAGYVTVRIGGEISETYDLSEDRIVELNGGTNTMKIERGKVDMTEAECPDKLCVHQKPISMNNESIICLPNKIVVQVVNQDESKIDAVTN